MGGPIIAPAPTPHGATEDADQHLPGGAGPPPRDLPTPSELANSPSSVASPESVGGGRTRPWSDRELCHRGAPLQEALLQILDQNTGRDFSILKYYNLAENSQNAEVHFPLSLRACELDLVELGKSKLQNEVERVTL